MSVGKRQLGRDGPIVSEITLGTWIEPEDGLARIVDAALACGITTFDTADVYWNGRSEKDLGTALRSHDRDSYVLLTKVFFENTAQGYAKAGLSRSHILSAIDGSLSRLGVDYVDILQAHRFDYDVPVEETIACLAEVVEMGKARYIGVSEWTAQQLHMAQSLAKEFGLPIVSNQAEYSMIYRVIEQEVLPECENDEIGVIVFGALAQGVLTGKYSAASAPDASRANRVPDLESGLSRYTSRHQLTVAIGRAAALAADWGWSMKDLALAWVLNNSAVTSVALGVSSARQVEDNCSHLRRNLPQELVRQVEDLLRSEVLTDIGLTAARSRRT